MLRCSDEVAGKNSLRPAARLATPAETSPPLDPKPLVRNLDGQTVLLVYSLGEPTSTLTLLGRHRYRTWKLAGRRQLETAATCLQQLWQERRQRSVEQAGELEARLAAELLAPALAELDHERLVIVTEGALDRLPFAALPDPRAAGGMAGERPRLLARHEVVQWPSLAAFAAARDEPSGNLPHARPSRLLAVIADPVFGRDDPRLRRRSLLGGLGGQGSVDLLRSITQLGPPRFDRLPQTLHEASAILRKAAGRAAEPPLAALGFDANRGLVLSGALEPYQVVHIATHGDFDRPRAEGPGLVLSLRDRHGAPIRGLLTAREISRLHLNADLVVLSGCKTGLDQQLADGTRLSLGQAFLAAGARRTIVSLWDVSDRSTAELMDRFYDRLLHGGLPAAAALRSAQLSMAGDPRWRHPYHWAGFVFQGEWR